MHINITDQKRKKHHMKLWKASALILTILILFFVTTILASASDSGIEESLPEVFDSSKIVFTERNRDALRIERQSRASESEQRSFNPLGFTISENATYYLADTFEGQLLTSTSISAPLTLTRFNSNTNHSYQRWKFIKHTSGNTITYSIHPANNTAYALGIDIATQTVKIMFYQNFSNQNWFLNFDTYGITSIASAYANNSTYYNKYLDYNSATSTWILTNGCYLEFGAIDSTVLVSPYSPQLSNMHLSLNERLYADPTGTAYIDGTSGFWMLWHSSNLNVMTIDDYGRINAVSEGSATLYFQDMITGDIGSCSIYVHCHPGGDFYIKDGSDVFLCVEDDLIIANANVIVSENQQQIWTLKIDHNSGYYYIKPKSNQNSNVYLCIGATSLSGSYIQQVPLSLRQYYSETNLPSTALWDIDVNGQNCIIIPFLGIDFGYYLSHQYLFNQKGTAYVYNDSSSPEYWHMESPNT